MPNQPDTPVEPSRRAVLGALAIGGTALTGGCVRRARTIAGWQSGDRVSLNVKTVPADADPYALRVARQLAEWYGEAGIDAQVTPMAEEELLRQVLLNHEFDVFVARAPREFDDPDTLYSLLHSRYAAALGWQNPFGYANLDVDEALTRQRRVGGSRRQEALTKVQSTVARTHPFTVVASPDDVAAVRDDRFVDWRTDDLTSARGYLALSPRPSTGETDGQEDTLRVATTDRRITENLNPLAVEFRRTDFLIDLLYDALGYVENGSIEPWLADSWAFVGNGSPTVRVRLREDLRWHDGEPLTAEDVAFTFAFLEDTSMGREEDGETEDGRDPVPAPRYQGRSDLVSGVEAADDRTLVFQFVDCDPRVAARAFTVPVLPEHVWSERTSPAAIGGIEVGGATEALVTNNVPPVGSGPLAFVSNTPREELVLERYDDHFLTRSDVSGIPQRFRGGPAFDRLVARIAGSDVAAVGMVADGDADVTATTVGASTVPRIGRAEETDLAVDRSARPYLIGYNVRRSPMSNPRFRHALARLVDRDHVVDQVFDGYASAAVSPLAGTDWVAEDLVWAGSDPVAPFPGSDGELDVERARDAFRDVGYRYDDGRLVNG